MGVLFKVAVYSMNDNYHVFSKIIKTKIMYHDRTKCQIVVFFVLYPMQQLLK